MGTALRVVQYYGVFADLQKAYIVMKKYEKSLLRDIPIPPGGLLGLTILLRNLVYRLR